MRKNLENNAYIDGANLYNGILSQGWKLDYRRFRRWLAEKHGVRHAYLFLGLIPAYAMLYRTLQESGFILVFKEVIYDGNGKPKGNCDADLVLQAAVDFFEKKFAKTPKKSVFNKIVGDSMLELEFAKFLDDCDDIVSFAKNYLEIQHRIDYRNADGSIAYYYPDFLVKQDAKTIYIIETKGREDLDDPRKIERLAQWCEDVNKQQNKFVYKMLYVKQNDWEKYRPKSFAECVRAFETRP